MIHPQNIEEIARLNYPEISEVGRRAFELAELKYLGIPTRPGFVIKTYFFKDFLQVTGIYEEIERAKSSPLSESEDFINKSRESIRKKVLDTPIPEKMLHYLHWFYRRLTGGLREKSVDIFSSGRTDKSELFSNIEGDANMVIKIKSIWATNLDSLVAIVVVKNLNFDLTGKIFTKEPIADKKLPENIQHKLLAYTKALNGHFYFPKEIDYGIKGDAIYVTDIKPFTGKIDPNTRRKNVLASGSTVNPGIATGSAKILRRADINERVGKNQILIVPDLTNRYYSKIKSAKAVVADASLSNAREKAIYKRNIQLTTIEGAKNATKIFKNGDIITADGTTGNICLGGLT